MWMGLAIVGGHNKRAKQRIISVERRVSVANQECLERIVLCFAIREAKGLKKITSFIVGYPDTPPSKIMPAPANKDVALVQRKVAILGFRAVGKSSLTNAFVSGTFSETYDPTIEATHHTTIRFRKVHFATDIVDTAGMDQYSRISRNASMGVHGYALLFSIASRQSFERIKEVNDSLLNTLGDAPDVPRVLVGSMHDLAAQRQVPQREAQALADLLGVPYIECSSKTGENVAEVFHTLLKEVEKDEGLLNETEDGGCIVL